MSTLPRSLTSSRSSANSVGVRCSGSPARRHLLAGEVDLEVAGERDRRRRAVAGRRRARAPQRRRDPRQQLLDAERLGHVVVGAEVERGDLVAVAAARRDDDHADGRALAHLAAELEAVDVRQHQVEQDDVGLLGLEQRERAQRRRSRRSCRSRARRGSSGSGRRCWGRPRRSGCCVRARRLRHRPDRRSSAKLVARATPSSWSTGRRTSKRVPRVAARRARSCRRGRRRCRLAIDRPRPAPAVGPRRGGAAPNERRGDVGGRRRCRRRSRDDHLARGARRAPRRATRVPGGLWRNAFSSRFTKTCSRRSWSAQTTGSSGRAARPSTSAALAGRQARHRGVEHERQVAPVRRAAAASRTRSPRSRAGRRRGGPSRADSAAMRLRKRCSDSPSQVTSGCHQARGVAADRRQRRAQLVAEAREEAALELLRAAQRRGLLAGALGLLALVREPQRVAPRPRAAPSRRSARRRRAQRASSALGAAGRGEGDGEVGAAAVVAHGARLAVARRRVAQREVEHARAASSSAPAAGAATPRGVDDRVDLRRARRAPVQSQQRDLVGLRARRRAPASTTTRPSLSGTGPASVSSTSWIVSSTRLRAVTSPSSCSRSTALAA